MTGHYLLQNLVIHPPVGGQAGGHPIVVSETSSFVTSAGGAKFDVRASFQSMEGRSCATFRRQTYYW